VEHCCGGRYSGQRQGRFKKLSRTIGVPPVQILNPGSLNRLIQLRVFLLRLGRTAIPSAVLGTVVS
jgi:hypothetical protein